MAVLFTAIIRASLTATILALEVTGDMTMLYPMLVASAAARLVPALFSEGSIMESLKERFLAGNQEPAK